MSHFHSRRALPLLVMALSAGCAMSTEDPASLGSTLSSEAVVTFAADWSVTVAGALREGGTLRIAYDAARTACTGSRYGRPAYAVQAHWRIDGGEVSTLVVAGHESYPGALDPVIELPRRGALELWFESSDAWGCHAWDSNFGANYRFEVGARDDAPGWVGNAAYVIDRATCDAGPCDRSRRPLEAGLVYDTYARQRAAIRAIYFDVWRAGTTDRENPDLWRELDVRAYYRFDPSAEWSWEYVDFHRRVGNDARYQLDLRHLDPLGRSTITDASACPAVPLEVVAGADGAPVYVRARLEIFFVVNGVSLEREDGTPFIATFEDYAGLYRPCID